jgi:hypothetical protein
VTGVAIRKSARRGFVNTALFTGMGGGGFSGSDYPTIANFRISSLSKGSLTIRK